jgi:hypothetical protein
MRQILALGLSVLLTMSGCASYTPSSAPIPKAGSLPFSRVEADVEAGADPHVQPDRQSAVFDADLAGAGILPIQVFARNQGTRRVLVRRSDITLALPDGRQLSSAGASAAAAKMESIGGVVGASIAFGLIGFLVASNAEEKARAARLADYRSKELQDVALGKDESARGFVFFIPAEGTPSFDEATLMVRCVDVEDASSFVIPLSLTGLKFKKAPEKTQGAADPPYKYNQRR